MNFSKLTCLALPLGKILEMSGFRHLGFLTPFLEILVTPLVVTTNMVGSCIFYDQGYL